MVKKKGNRDGEKKEALLAKKEAKQEKLAKKRLIKFGDSNGVHDHDDDDDDDNDDDSDTSCSDDNDDDEAFNQLLRQYNQQLQLTEDIVDDDKNGDRRKGDKQTSTHSQLSSSSSSAAAGAAAVIVSSLPEDHPFPFPRANFTCTITDDTKRKEVYVFGGEYYDGTNTVVSDQLFKYDLSNNSWKQIIIPSTANTSSSSSSSSSSNNNKTPSPRCAHAAGYYNKSLYIFGGESSHCPNSVQGKKKRSKKKDTTASNTATATATATATSSTDYYHYKDIWRYDTVQQQWYEIKPTIPSSAGAGVGGKCSTPTPRSGMSMTMWKHYMIIFGGFYEAAVSSSSSTTTGSSSSTPRWYNDLYVLDLQTEQWLDIPHSKLSNILRPEPRSACNHALVVRNVDDTKKEEVWIIHGGFSKLQTNASRQQNKSDSGFDTDGLPIAETIVYTDTWILHLQPILSGKPPVWERVTTSLSKTKRYDVAQTVHNGRSGVTSISYQNNLLLFGGVLDQELLHHKLDSIFYNDLSIFHLDRRKFIPIQIQEASSNSGSTSKKHGGKSSSTINKNDDDDDINNNQGAVSEVIQELVLGIDDSNIAEKKKNIGWDIEKLRTNMFTFVDGDGNVIYEKIDSVMQKQQNSDKESVRQRILERTEPLPRIKACAFLNGHVLYIYGGLLEIGDREVTLDDMWSIDLRNIKNRIWKCIYPGTMHEQIWRGAVNDDDDSYYSNNKNDDDDDENDRVDATNNKKNATTTTNKNNEDKTLIASSNQGDVVIKPVSVSTNPKQEMIELVQRYNMDDDEQTPRPGETISDFFSRTESYWMKQHSDENNIHRGKVCYDLAQNRYDELVPIMQRLTELKLLRKKEKANKK